MERYIRAQIADSAATKNAILENQELINVIVNVAKACVDVYRNGKKTILAGNGGSAADAQQVRSPLFKKI